jgi:hypothetical protein
VESYETIFIHLSLTCTQKLKTALINDIPDQTLMEILLGQTQRTNTTWQDLSQEIQKILIEQAPSQPFTILHNISRSLIPIIQSIKQRLPNIFEYPLLKYPRPTPGLLLDPATSNLSTLNWKTLPHSRIKF